MDNCAVKIRRDGENYFFNTKLSDIEVLSLIGKALRVLSGQKEHGDFYPPCEINQDTPVIALYYEIRDCGESKVTIVSRETQYITSQILQSAVAMLVTKLYSK